MGLLLGTVGAGLIAAAVVDMLKTTVVVGGGGGPLTQRLAQRMWRLALRRHAKRPARAGLVRWAYAIVFTLIGAWVLALWLGWTLVFSAGERAVLDADTLAPAGAWSRAYFAGFSLITLGVGDYVPGGAPWQVLTVLAAANGFFVVTLTITYLAPVLSAVATKRSLAASIIDLGATPSAIVRNAWLGGGVAELDTSFTALASTIRQHEQRHLAYPLLFYTVSEERRSSDAVALAVLDEALTLIEHGLSPEHRARSPASRALRRALTAFLDMREASSVERAAPPQSVPSLAGLRDAGVPVVDDEVLDEAVAGLAERRRRLAAFVREAGWSWDTVHGACDQEDGQAHG